MERTKRTELTVSKIQEAALKEFGVNGYAGGTINNICKRGSTRGLSITILKIKMSSILYAWRTAAKSWSR